MEKPGYFAVIPSVVRYCPDLQPNAKLLYGEISTLCNATGFCWASDQFFADNFEVTTKTIQNLLAALAAKHFIIIKDDKYVDGNRLRMIFLNPAALVMTAGNIPGKLEKIFHGMENNFPELENFFTGIYCNNKNNNNPPIVPQKGDGKKGRKKKGPAPEFEPERFARFWAFYRGLVPSGVRIGGKADAKEAWNRLRPDEKLRRAMLASLKTESASKSWQEGSGIKYVSTWLNDFARGNICETGGAQDPAPAPAPTWGWD